MPKASKRLHSALLFLASIALVTPACLLELGVIPAAKVRRAAAAFGILSPGITSDDSAAFDRLDVDELFESFEQMAAAASIRALSARAGKAGGGSYKTSVGVSITLMVEDPVGVVAWDANEAVSRHFQPQLELLRDYFHFDDIITQVKYYASLSAKTPSKATCANDNDSDEPFYFYYAPNEMSEIFGANDWTDTPLFTESYERTAHFLLFLPRCSARPLYIREHHRAGAKTQSFFISNWGGAAILGGTCPEDGIVRRVTAQDSEMGFRAFGRHLKTLLGIEGDARDPAVCKSHARSFLRQTAQVAKTLRPLVAAMPSMSALDRVVGNVRASLARFNASAGSCCFANENDDECGEAACAQALRSSRGALQSIVDAFYDPDLLPQLYFPDQHLLAVHMPLLAPLILPLIVGLVKEIKRHKRKLKTAAEGAKAKMH